MLEGGDQNINSNLMVLSNQYSKICTQMRYAWKYVIIVLWIQRVDVDIIVAHTINFLRNYYNKATLTVQKQTKWIAMYIHDKHFTHHGP